MIKYSFLAYGHKNIQATHRNTLEITKDDFVTKSGNCIIAIKSNFELRRIIPFLKCKRCKLTIKADNIAQVITFTPNPNFSDEKEIVIRLNYYISDRTLGIDADKSSLFLDNALKEKLKSPEQKIFLTLESIQ